MISSVISIAKTMAMPVSWTLIHSLWQGLLIAGILFIIMFIFPNASSRIRYTLACGAMLLMFTGTITTFNIILNDNYAPTRILGSLSNTEIAPIQSGEKLYSEGAEMSAITANTSTLYSSEYLIMNWLFYFWLAGVILIWVYNLIGWQRTRYLISNNVNPVTEYWQSQFEFIGEKLKINHTIKLVQSTLVKTPCVIGWIKPVVLAPISIFYGFNASYLELILAHELAHIKRHDILLNYILTFVETLLFFNPFVWWISRQIRIERENCCDDMVVSTFGDKVSYAEALVGLERIKYSNSGLAMAVDGGILMPRIRRLVTQKNETHYRPGFGAILIAMVSLIITIGACALTGMNTTIANATPTASAQLKIPPSDYDYKGNWEAEWYIDEVTFKIDFNNYGNNIFEVWADDLGGISKAPETEFTLVRDAGTFYFEGGFDKIGNESLGSGKCYFVSNPEYFKELDRIGYSNGLLDIDFNPKKKILQLALSNMTFEYARTMKELGYSNLSLDRLIKLFFHGVNPKYITGLAEAGYSNLSDEELLKMRDHGVDARYIAELKYFGHDNISTSELVKLRDHGVDGDFIAALARYGYNDLDLDELLKMRDHGVDGNYIAGLTKYGYDDLTASELVTLRDHGVDGSFIADLEILGYKGLPASVLRKMRDHGVDGSFISGLNRYGYDDLEPLMLIKMRDHGVDSGYLSQLVNLGYDDLDPLVVVEMRDHGVSADFIEKANERRGRKLSPERLIKLRDRGYY